MSYRSGPPKDWRDECIISEMERNPFAAVAGSCDRCQAYYRYYKNKCPDIHIVPDPNNNGCKHPLDECVISERERNPFAEVAGNCDRCRSYYKQFLGKYASVQQAI